MQHIKHPNIEAHSKIKSPSISGELARPRGPYFRIKWNTPLNVFGISDRGAPDTLTIQASYHRL